MVPEVNGVVSVSGESMFSVLVIFALVGVEEYVAANEGLMIDAPTGTVCPPVKLVIEKGPEPESEIMILPPPAAIDMPVPATRFTFDCEPLTVPTS
jgi:hypothetical protein